MKKRKTYAKLGLLFTTLLILLASISISYATWTDTITIQGTINTLDDFNYLCLQGYWTFDETSGTTAHDSSMYENDGIVYGATWTPGKIDGALSFDGTNDYVQVPDDETLEPTEVTVIAWVKSPEVERYDYILSKGAKGNTAASYALYTGSNGGLYFYIFNGANTFILSPNGGSDIWNDEWHHIAGVFDGSTVRLYIDGSEVGTGTPASITIGYNLPTTDDLFIGSYNTGYNFNGLIDEVKIYSCALTADEILADYEAGL